MPWDRRNARRADYASMGKSGYAGMKNNWTREISKHLPGILTLIAASIALSVSADRKTPWGLVLVYWTTVTIYWIFKTGDSDKK